MREARRQWIEEAQARLDALLAEEPAASLHDEAQTSLNELQGHLNMLRRELKIEPPKIEIPEPEIVTTANGLPLIDSDWAFSDQSRRLKDSRAYRITE